MSECNSKHEVTSRHRDHIARLTDEFTQKLRSKYLKGVEEHGGSLEDYSDYVLLNNALDEVLDLYAYLGTARNNVSERWFSEYLDETLVLEVVNECANGDKLHGKMTTDIFRALSILGEELGESHRAALEVRRGEADINRVIEELVQVMAVSARIVKNLRNGRVEWWGREDTRKERAKVYETAKVAGTNGRENTQENAPEMGGATSILPSTSECKDGIKAQQDDVLGMVVARAIVCQGRRTCR